MKKIFTFFGKELTGLKGDFLVLRDFNKNKSEHKKYAWMKGPFGKSRQIRCRGAAIC